MNEPKATNQPTRSYHLESIREETIRSQMDGDKILLLCDAVKSLTEENANLKKQVADLISTAANVVLSHAPEAPTPSKDLP
jgi:hypothetical protein